MPGVGGNVASGHAAFLKRREETFAIGIASYRAHHDPFAQPQRRCKLVGVNGHVERGAPQGFDAVLENVEQNFANAHED
jgi:hypothetical protein